ncbi:MAG: hypothetical protein R3301_06405 [Saprospiraceae bacterium]|nr:hypothetical protein [Saprospiraceae bacterium]
MKQYTLLLVAALAVVLVACGGSKDNDVRDNARESLGLQNQPTTPPPTTSPTITPPPAGSTVAAAGGVQHYICPNNCEGSGGPSAGTCPVCGTEYTHNQAYHSQNNAATTTPTVTPGTTTPTPPAATNAAGVYHYTCPSGCAGGAASAGTCATCGATLAHNPAYHQ